MVYEMNFKKVRYETEKQINKIQKIKLAYLRRLSQTLMLFVIGEFSFYGIFRCPFTIPYISCVNCPVIQCPGRLLIYPFWIFLGISAILFGRSFCGWACPVGLISSLISKFTSIGKKIKIKSDKKLHMIKYFVLLVTLFIWFVMLNPRWAIPIRTGEFLESVSLTFQHADNLWVIRTSVVLILIFIGGLFVNLWCRYICPTGGILETMRKFGLFQFRKSKDCNNCGLCRNVCEFSTEPERYNCTNCGKCKNSCPSNAIYFGK
jgi:polyferredoxin